MSVVIVTLKILQDWDFLIAQSFYLIASIVEICHHKQQWL